MSSVFTLIQLQGLCWSLACLCHHKHLTKRKNRQLSKIKNELKSWKKVKNSQPLEENKYSSYRGGQEINVAVKIKCVCVYVCVCVRVREIKRGQRDIKTTLPKCRNAPPYLKKC